MLFRSRILPSGGRGSLEQLILPALTLGFALVALIARVTRSCMLDALKEDYVRTARAKGLPEQVVVVGHIMKNAMIPVATIVGPATAALITGSFIIEQIFSIPGLGREFILSIQKRDYPVIMGVYLLYAFVIAVANLTVDLVYGMLDPRIKVGR